MAYIQSRIERFWNTFGLLVCLAAAADVVYWRRTVWEMLLFPVLMVVAGNLFARFDREEKDTSRRSRIAARHAAIHCHCQVDAAGRSAASPCSAP